MRFRMEANFAENCKNWVGNSFYDEKRVNHWLQVWQAKISKIKANEKLTLSKPCGWAESKVTDEKQ